MHDLAGLNYNWSHSEAKAYGLVSLDSGVRVCGFVGTGKGDEFFARDVPVPVVEGDR